MKKKFICLLLLLQCAWTQFCVAPAFSVGRAQIVVSSVYWGDSTAATISARPGDVNIPLSIVLSNVGDDVARTVIARLDLAAPFSFEYYQDGEKKSSTSVSVTAGDIQAGTGQRLRFILNIASNATEGIYRLRLQVSYSSARELQEATVIQNVDVPIWSGKLHIQRVVTLPEKIYPGSTGVILKVWIVNTGQGAEQEVEARLALSEPFKASSSGSDRIFLGIIPSYQTALTEFHIDIDESAAYGDYSVHLLMVVGKTTQSLLGLVPLYLNEKARLRVVRLDPEEINSGDTGVTVGLLIKNMGGVAAKSVRVQLRPGNYFSGSLTDFLGTVDPGDQKTAFVTVDVDGKTPEGDYKIDLRIDWTQDESSLYDTITVIFRVRRKQFFVQYAPHIALAVLATVAIMYYRRRKRKSQSS